MNTGVKSSVNPLPSMAELIYHNAAAAGSLSLFSFFIANIVCHFKAVLNARLFARTKSIRCKSERAQKGKSEKVQVNVKKLAKDS